MGLEEGILSILFDIKRATRGASACAARATSTIRQSSFHEVSYKGVKAKTLNIEPLNSEP
jgi:hypothetical protein